MLLRQPPVEIGRVGFDLTAAFPAPGKPDGEALHD
jgi:hypothetical protein